MIKFIQNIPISRQIVAHVTVKFMVYVNPMAVIPSNPNKFLLALNVGNGWVAGGCWDDYY